MLLSLITFEIIFMKTYQYKNYQIIITKSQEGDHKVIDAYNELTNELLLYRNVADSRIFQLIYIGDNTITSKPHIIKSSLLKIQLPAFQFLVCKS
jgi:hypothetical protein